MYNYYLFLNNVVYEDFIFGFDLEFYNEFGIYLIVFLVWCVNVFCDLCIVWLIVI